MSTRGDNEEKLNLPNFKSECIDLGCTFGRGFNNQHSFSLQNSIVLRMQGDSPSQEIEEDIEGRDRYVYNESNEKKQRQEKSTE